MIARPLFPPVMDSTMLESFRSCPQKFFRQYVQHWKPKAESVHLVAGGAFAKGIEVARKAYYEGQYQFAERHDEVHPETGMVDWKVRWTVQQNEPGDRESSEACGLAATIAVYGDFECPPESAKSLERTAGALEYYFSVYPLGADGMEPVRWADGHYAIEFSFAEPLDFPHPVSGDPILYTGRADLVANFAGGIYIDDEKTTTSLGASWGRQWEMRSQFTGYVWALKKATGIQANGCIVRGISILKTKYDTQQVITNRSPYEVDRWYGQTHRDLAKMKQMWEEGYWDYNLGHSCAEYGGCGLVQVCKSDDPETWLPVYFEPKVWDPLARREISVEGWEKEWGHLPA
jgi:hypothetical protein